MNNQHDERVGRPKVTIDMLLHQHARVAGDLFKVDTHTWAIHGFIPVDGEVILAEFDGSEKAVAALAELSAEEDRIASRRQRVETRSRLCGERSEFAGTSEGSPYDV